MLGYVTELTLVIITITVSAMFVPGRLSLYSRGFALLEEDAGEGELERGLHHLHRQGLHLQRELVLGGRGAGVPPHVHVDRGQHLPVAFSLLGVGWGSVVVCSCESSVGISFDTCCIHVH